MWAMVRGVAVAVLGDDIFKIVASVILGFLVVGFLEATAVIGAIDSMPWGSWWLAGVGGGVQGSSAAEPVAAEQPSQGSPRVDVPPSQPQSQASLPVAIAPVPTIIPVVADNNKVAQVIAAAMTWLGTRYGWGGCDHRGIDCSCFVMNVLATVGIHAPRVTTAQIGWGLPVSQPSAGDMVFFDNTCSDCGANPTHVGLYLGGGTMVDCGDPCKIEPVYGGHNARYRRPPGL
jgi:cell wall-associated NlpC family hydrolase